MRAEAVVAESDRVPGRGPLRLKAPVESTSCEDKLVDAVVLLGREARSERQTDGGEGQLTQLRM